MEGQPRRNGTGHLVGEFLCHDLLRVGVVQVGEIHEGLPHVFVPEYQYKIEDTSL